jgi:hypothetical protein
VYHEKMTIVGRGNIGHHGWLVVAMVVAAIGGCGLLRPSAPESRAEYFIKKLVLEPQAVDDLRAVAVLPESAAPDDLLADVSTRTAVTYLRARTQLDTDLGFHVAGSARPAADERRVEVVVSEGLAVGVRPTVRFSVELKKAGGDWRVVRLRAD